MIAEHRLVQVVCKRTPTVWVVEVHCACRAELMDVAKTNDLPAEIWLYRRLWAQHLAETGAPILSAEEYLT